MKVWRRLFFQGGHDEVKPVKSFVQVDVCHFLVGFGVQIQFKEPVLDGSQVFGGNKAFLEPSQTLHHLAVHPLGDVSLWWRWCRWPLCLETSPQFFSFCLSCCCCRCCCQGKQGALASFSYFEKCAQFNFLL